MASIALLAVTFPLFFGAEPPTGLQAEGAELSGRVLEERTDRPFPSPLPVSIELCATHQLCLAEARVRLDGRYVLRARPGEYWVRIRLNGREARVERYALKAGSWRRDFSIPFASPRPLLAAAGAPENRQAGVGGAGGEGDAPDAGPLLPERSSLTFGLPELELDSAWRALVPVARERSPSARAPTWWRATRGARPAAR